MHKSYLEFGYHVEDLLFKGLSVNSVGGMVGLCLCVAFFTFSYEAVRTLRMRYASKTHTNHVDNHDRIANHSERDMLVDLDSPETQNLRRMKMHVIQAILYMVQVAMSYMLMLVIMSYNAWLALTVFATAGISYYFFSTFVLYRPSVIPIEILAPESSCE